ncbi:MAG: hypothetical protein IIA44_14765 [Acidobacteria bacterium]|nr:hypothetical protein [Acidobacteriota bacterium]
MADTWRVVAQRQTSDISRSGDFQDVMEVTVETTTGRVISVRIPVDQYNAELANQMIEDRVSEVIAVDNL